jgi:hypothetical protein
MYALFCVDFRMRFEPSGRMFLVSKLAVEGAMEGISTLIEGVTASLEIGLEGSKVELGVISWLEIEELEVRILLLVSKAVELFLTISVCLFLVELGLSAESRRRLVVYRSIVISKLIGSKLAI